MGQKIKRLTTRTVSLENATKATKKSKVISKVAFFLISRKGRTSMATHIDQDDSTTIHNHGFEDNFTITFNRTPENSEVSWQAKGLLWYILTRPKNWVIHYWQLASVYKGQVRGGGRDGVRSMLKELREHGYVTYEKYQDEKGKWKHRYDVYPMPVKDFQKIIPEPAKPALVQPGPVKPFIKQVLSTPNTELDVVVLSDGGKNDDASHGEGQSGADIYTVNLYDGSQIQISAGDVYTAAIQQKKDWTQDEIRVSLNILKNSCELIRDWVSYIDGIIKNNRLKHKVKRKFKKEVSPSRCNDDATSQPEAPVSCTKNADDRPGLTRAKAYNERLREAPSEGMQKLARHNDELMEEREIMFYEKKESGEITLKKMRYTCMFDTQWPPLHALLDMILEKLDPNKNEGNESEKSNI